MTDNKKPPAKRAPRQRSKAKAHSRSPDAAQRTADGPVAAPEAGAPEPPRNRRANNVRAATTGDESSASRVLAVIPLHVRWRDLDAFNHVNNSSYLTYLEESRLQWLRTVPGEWFSEHAMPVMAAIELHYRKPITWPAEIDVQLTCERLGNSSLTIGNRIVDRSDVACVYSEGKTVMVWVDPTTGASVPLPQALRNAVAPK